jgi:hypothetical protein
MLGEKKNLSSISNQTMICTLSSLYLGDYWMSHLCPCKYKLHLLFLFHLILLCTEIEDMPVNTENNFWQINLLPLTAFVENYETSVIGNMCVASQRITMYQMIITFVLNLNISKKISLYIFLWSYTTHFQQQKNSIKSCQTCHTGNSSV